MGLTETKEIQGSLKRTQGKFQIDISILPPQPVPSETSQAKERPLLHHS
jgi:hypothetical protein